MSNFPSGKPSETQLETVICRHCKRPVLKRTAKEHIQGCLKSKQEKARKKKEAREAAARAKEKADAKDEEEEDDDDIKDGSKGSGAKNSTANGVGGADEGTKKAKKRKADTADDDKDKEPKKKKKKDEPKPKTAKPKGPVDVERQCGVLLPNGQQCARSLTCKSHSMGAKRAVAGRSLPYDVLLQAYQKKNQARQQSKCLDVDGNLRCSYTNIFSAEAAIEANAPLLFDEDVDGNLGPVDSDEERDAVMTAISRGLNRPQPLATNTLFSTRRKYQLIRMKEMLSNALTGNRSGGLFSLPRESLTTAYPGSAVTESFALPSAITPSAATANAGVKAASRKSSVEVT